MTLEQIIAYIATEGYLVTNLFQVHETAWRANLRNGCQGAYFDFANGATANAALFGALEKARKGPDPIPPKPKPETCDDLWD